MVGTLPITWGLLHTPCFEARDGARHDMSYVNIMFEHCAIEISHRLSLLPSVGVTSHYPYPIPEFSSLKTNTHRLYESLGEDLPGLGLQGRGLGEPALVHHLALPITLHLVRVTSETFRLVRA